MGLRGLRHHFGRRSRSLAPLQSSDGIARLGEMDDGIRTLSGGDTIL
jgi:hypothetical protein